MIGAGALPTLALLAAGAALGWLWLGRSALPAGRRLLWAAALAPALGLGPPGLVVFAFAAAGRRLPGSLGFAALLATVFLALAWTVRAMRAPLDRLAGDRPASPCEREPLPLRLVALAVLIAVTIPAARFTLAAVRHWPAGTWDAVAIWNARAELLQRDSGAAAAVLARLDPDAHPHYPLLVSSSLAASWKLLGRSSHAAAAMQSLAWLAGLLVLSALALSRARRWAPALLAAAALLALPPLLKWGPSQCADLAVAYALLLAYLSASAWVRTDAAAERLPPGIAGLALGWLAATKSEGAMLAVGLLAGWLLAAFCHGPQRPRRWRVELLWAAPFLLLLAAQRLLLPSASRAPTYLAWQWLDRVLEPERWAGILEALWERLAGGPGPHGWGFFWAVVVILAALGWTLPRHRTARAPGLAALTASACTLLAAFLFTTLDLAQHLATALDRLLLQVAPLALVLAAAPHALAETGLSRSERRSAAIRASVGLQALIARHPRGFAAATLLAIFAVKAGAILASLGAMWRWPEELVVATTAIDRIASLGSDAIRQLSAFNLTSLAIVPVDLFALEGPARYRALLLAANAAAALLVAATLALRRSSNDRRLPWAGAGVLALSVWALLGDALAGASFVLLLAALEPALADRNAARPWLAVTLAALLVALANPTLIPSLVAALLVALISAGPPTNVGARLGAGAALLAGPAVAWWAAAGPQVLVRGAGSYLDLAADAPIRLFAARGMPAFLPWLANLGRQLGYLHVATLGWALTTLIAAGLVLRRRNGEVPWRATALAFLAAVLLRAGISAAGMSLLPQGRGGAHHLISGRAMEFAIPAGLWLGALGIARLRRERSRVLAAWSSLLVAAGAAALFLGLRAGRADPSSLQRLVPDQSALALHLRLARWGDWTFVVSAASLAAIVALAIAPWPRRWRLAARLAAATFAGALLGGTAFVALGEAATESRGSELFHSRAAELVREAHAAGRAKVVAVDAPVRGPRAATAEAMLAWKDSLRVVADLPRIALAAPDPAEGCPAVLSPERLPGRALLAVVEPSGLLLWGPRGGGDCEPIARPGASPAPSRASPQSP